MSTLGSVLTILGRIWKQQFPVNVKALEYQRIAQFLQIVFRKLRSIETPLKICHPWLPDWLATLRKDLSVPGLIRTVQEQFSKFNDPRCQGSIRFTLPDTLCAALAMFQFKRPSLLQFDEHCDDDQTHIGNLRRLYSFDKVASVIPNRYIDIELTERHSSHKRKKI